MRILQVAPDHPAWTTGGTEFVASDLTRALNAWPGVEARLLACTTSLQCPAPADGPLFAHGDDTILWTDAFDRFALTRLDAPVWSTALERLLAEFPPDVVHLHGVDRIGVELIPWLRRFAPRCRILLSLHAYQLPCANDGTLLRTHDGQRCDGPSADGCRRCFPDRAVADFELRDRFLRQALAEVDLFIAPSAFLRDRHVAWGLPAERFVVVPNALPESQQPAPSPAHRRAQPGWRRSFAYFGNLAEHKGVLVLLEAAARLQARGADLHVALHGGFQHAGAAFRARFEARLAQAEPVASHVGAYRRADLPGLMAAADWVVVPSLWWENAPLVILEAFRAGRPVICSGIGGMAELVADGVNGLHVVPGHAGDLADTMAEAAERPELWSRLAQAVPRVPTTTEWAEQHLSLYAEGGRCAAA